MRPLKTWGLFVCILLPVTAVIIISTVEFHIHLTEMAVARRQAVSEMAALALRIKLDQILDLGTSFADRVQFRKLIKEGRWEDASHILKSATDKWPYLERVFLTDTEGTLKASLPPTDEVIRLAHRDWYQQIAQNWKPFVSDVYKRNAAPQINVVTAAIPILEDETQTPLGILGLQIRLESLRVWSDVIKPEEGFLYAVDSKGQAVIHPDFPPQGEVANLLENPAVAAVIKGQHGVQRVYNPRRKKEMLVAFRPVSNYGWGVLYAEDAQSAFASRNRFIFITLLFNSLILLAAAGLAFWITKILIALRQNEKKFRTVVESARDSIIICDQNDRILDWNSGAEKLFGYSREEILGKPLTGVLAESCRKKHEEEVDRLLNSSDGITLGRTLEVIGLRKDGSEFSMEVSFSLWEILGQRFFTAIIRDLSERRRMEDIMRRKNEELVRNQAEIEQMQLFAFAATHDLQEPLHKIMTFSDLVLIQQKEHLNEASQKDLVRIQEAAVRMRDMMEQLRELSRITTQANFKEGLDLNEIVKETLQDLEVRIQETGAKISRDPLPVLRADPLQMRQLFQNLLSNALKFRKPETAPFIKISSSFYNQGEERWAEITVQDNGIGFDEIYKSKIFKPFQRLHTRQEYAGSGIGLAICKQIVVRHGGRLDVKSAPGEGSTFILKLPAL